jgi:hypothetical protein
MGKSRQEILIRKEVRQRTYGRGKNERITRFFLYRILINQSLQKRYQMKGRHDKKPFKCDKR